MSIEVTARIPPFFPHATKECKVVAEAFFECFNDKAVKIVAEDGDAGRRGMLKCLSEMKKYSDCMTESELKYPPKRMRVSTVKYNITVLHVDLSTL